MVIVSIYYFDAISIPTGTIKRVEKLETIEEIKEFQFLLVRLKDGMPKKGI